MPTNPKDFNPLTDNITLSIKELKIWTSFKQGSFILIKCTSSHPEVFAANLQENTHVEVRFQ